MLLWFWINKSLYSVIYPAISISFLWGDITIEVNSKVKPRVATKNIVGILFFGLTSFLQSCHQELVKSEKTYSLLSVNKLSTAKPTIYLAGIAYDSVLGQLYVGSHLNSKVYTLDPLSGAAIDSTITGSVVEGLVTAPGTGKAYGAGGMVVSQIEMPEVKYVTPTDIAWPPFVQSKGIAYSSSNKIYVAVDSPNRYQILLYDLTFSFPVFGYNFLEVSTDDPSDRINDLVMDHSNSNLYFVTYRGNIRKINLKSREVSDVVSTAADNETKIAIDTNDNLYWVSPDKRSIVIYNQKSKTQKLLGGIPEGKYVGDMDVFYNNKAQQLYVWVVTPGYVCIMVYAIR